MCTAISIRSRAAWKASRSRLAREREARPRIDEVEIRVADQVAEEQDVRVLARIPLPNPLTSSSMRRARSAQTRAAMEALREVGPAGHYLGTAHTRARFQDAFFMPELLDNNSFEQWQAEGSLDAAQRANVLCKKALEQYEAPALDPAVDEALQAFIEDKKISMPDAFA